MLEIKCDKGDGRIVHGGDPIMTAIELAIAAGRIYNNLKREDEVTAEVFMMALRKGLEPESALLKPDEKDVVFVIPKQKNGGAPTGQS